MMRATQLTTSKICASTPTASFRLIRIVIILNRIRQLESNSHLCDWNSRVSRLHENLGNILKLRLQIDDPTKKGDSALEIEHRPLI